MAVLKLTSVGTSTGVVLPKEMLKHLNLEKGDMLHATETREGYLLTPYDPKVEAQIEHGRRFMKQYRETFKALAEG